MTQPGPVPLSASPPGSESAALTEWHCGRWPGQVGPLKAPASGQAPATAARGPARNRAGLADSEPESEDPGPPTADCTASGSLSLSHGGLPSTRASGPDRPGRATVVGPLGCLRFGTAGLRCLS